MIKPGTVVLEAKNSNWNMGRVMALPRADALKKTIVITLKPTQALKVLVNDQKGAPLKDAEVFLSSTMEGWSKSGRTDEKGEVVFPQILFGNKYGLGARLGGYYFAAQHMELPEVGTKDWKDTVELVMEEARRTQKGRVVDSDGKPVAGAEVETIFGQKAVTDSNGDFTLNNLPDCDVQLYVDTMDSYGSAEANKDSGDIVIQMKRLSTR